MDHVLSELSTITRLSWVVLPDMAHSFIELDKAEILVISLGNFLWFVVFTLSSLWWIRVGGLLSLPDGRDWLWGNLGLALLGRAILSKSLNQFSVDGEASFPLCSLAWGQTVVGAMAIMATSFKKIYASMLGLQDCYIQFSSRPLSACASSGDCWALTGKSGTVCSFFLGPGMHKVLFMPHHRATRHLSPTIQPPRRQSTDWRTIIPKQFSYCCKSSRTHNRFPNLGIQQSDWEPPGNLTLKTNKIWLQNFYRTGETDYWRTQIT